MKKTPGLNLLSRSLLLLSIQFLFGTSILASYTITHLEPPSWWVGMKNTHLQIMVHGPAISDLKPEIVYPGIEIREVILVPNPNYLFIQLEIGENTLPGEFVIQFKKKNKVVLSHPYTLYEREDGSVSRKGFDPSDVIYLVTPDRFANGDLSNDDVEGYLEQAERGNKDGRHGGDIKGIVEHLDYMTDMGFTALWLNPVLENNMPRTSYHGYAITDYYKVDPRYGTNEDYRELSREAKKRGIKLIMDMVENHCGLEHWWMKDLPSDDWINYGGKYVGTNHRRTTVQDPYVSPSDKELFPTGWFVPMMPDLNQRNPLMAAYLIQNSIWWVEYAGLAGIRQDTYSYPDKDFMSDWSCAIMNEYPGFSIVGEEWSLNPAIVSYWQKGKGNKDGYTSCLGSLMDFPLQAALVKALNDGEKIYNEGLVNLYEMLANDFLYADPFQLVTFPDNHDMSRFFTQVNEDVDLFRMGIAYILTMRGIPQIYYGTEVLMANPGSTDHGDIRSDFPGGWPGDAVNAFTGTGLTAQQAEIKDFMKNLLNWRKGEEVIHSGQLMHYTPDHGTYVYFRYDKKDMVMVIFNKNEETFLLDTGRFREVIGQRQNGRDVITGKGYELGTLELPPRSVLVLEIF